MSKPSPIQLTFFEKYESTQQYLRKHHDSQTNAPEPESVQRSRRSVRARQRRDLRRPSAWGGRT